MAEAIDLSQKEVFQLVSFTHGGGAAYYTDWTSDYQYQGNTYVSTPELEVELPLNDGLFGENDCKVAIPVVDDPAHFSYRISSGQPHAPVTCTIREVSRAIEPGHSQSIDTTFIGQIHISRKNFRGRQDKILLQCLSIKSRLATIAFGIPCHHLCDNRLGDARCKIDMNTAGRTVSVQIDSIDGREVTIVANGTVSGQSDRFYHRGFIQFQGLNLGIRDWRSADPTKFLMQRQPPSYWDGQTVTLFAGCDQSVEVCRDRYDNEENFNGLGYAMPTYHPSFEDVP